MSTGTEPQPPPRSSARAGIGLLALGVVGAVLAWLLVASLGTDAPVGAGPTTRPRPAATSSTTTSPSPAPSPVPSPSEASPGFDDVADDLRTALVRVVVKTCDGTRHVGSGFHVGRRRVVTIARGLGRADEVRVGVGGEQRPVAVVAVQASSGIALLEDPAAGVERPATLAIDGPVEGAEVAFLGADPERGLVRVAPTRVAAGPADEGLPVLATADLAPDPSFAGGPVVTPDGRIVGMALVNPHRRSEVATARVLADRVQAWSEADRRGRQPGCEAVSPSPEPTASAPPEPSPDPEFGPAPSPEPTPTPEPTPEPSPGPTAAPAPARWIGVLESLAVQRHTRAEAVRVARGYRQRLDDDVRVLRSDDFGSLNPGYWVVSIGTWNRKPGAVAGCDRAVATGAACYPRRLAR